MLLELLLNVPFLRKHYFHEYKIYMIKQGSKRILLFICFLIALGALFILFEEICTSCHHHSDTMLLCDKDLVLPSGIGPLHIDHLDDLEYRVATREDRLRFNLPLREEDISICDKDIGEYVGDVTSAPVGACRELVGSKVYRYANYPRSNAILILKNQGSYHLICTKGYKISIPEGTTINAALMKYECPQKVIKIEVRGQDGSLIRLIKEQNTIVKIIENIRDCKNIGYDKQSQRLQQVLNDLRWQDLPSNHEKVSQLKRESYDFSKVTEESIRLRSEIMDTEGEIEVLSEDDKTAANLQKGNLHLFIEIEEGYEIEILYVPLSQTYLAFDGAFDMTRDKSSSLQKLLLQ